MADGAGATFDARLSGGHYVCGEADAAAGVPDDLAPARRKFNFELPGWSEAERSAFLDRLTACGCVTRAAVRAGKTPSSAHSLRKRDATFDAAWTDALVGFRTSMQALAMRIALRGVVEEKVSPIGGTVKVRRFPEKLVAALLADRGPAVAGAPVVELLTPGKAGEEARLEIEARLALLENKRRETAA